MLIINLIAQWMKRINGTDVEVTKEDQERINTFSRQFQRRQELEESLMLLKEKINQHQDTLDEIELNDDSDELRYRFGSCFFYLPSKLFAT